MGQISWTENGVMQTDNFNYNLHEKCEIINIESMLGKSRIQINSTTEVFVGDLLRCFFFFFFFLHGVCHLLCLAHSGYSVSSLS